MMSACRRMKRWGRVGWGRSSPTAFSRLVGGGMILAGAEWVVMSDELQECRKRGGRELG